MRSKPSRFVALVLVACLAPLFGCQTQNSQTKEGRQTEIGFPKHLILVTVDTLRADHLAPYGSDIATPFFDRLAQEGTLVEQASAHVPLTRPSHVALFSGLLPFETGVRDNLSPATIPDVPLLAEVLRDAGFKTGATVSSVVVAAASGLDRGFDSYLDDFASSPDDPDFLQSAQKRGDQTLREAIEWLEAHQDQERTFLWVHLYDPHEPYEPPEPFASAYPDRPYAGEVAWSDQLLERLDSAVRRLGREQETLWVVTSDHGEGLGEHGEQLHGFFAYQSTLRVPLFFRGPGVAAAQRLQQVVGLVDLYPTLIDLLGLMPLPEQELSGRLSGKNLAQQLRTGKDLMETSPAPFYGETLVPKLHFGWSDLRVTRQGQWKLIHAPRPELYNLAIDPNETNNLFGIERRQGHALQQQLDGFLERESVVQAALSAGGNPGGDESTLSQETRDQLAALGYVSAGGGANTDSPGADPKDKIEDFRKANALIREGVRDLNDDRFAEAEESFRELVELDIESPEILRHWGRSLLGMEEPARAAEAFRRRLTASPKDASAWQDLSEAELRQGNPQAALRTLRDSQVALPQNLPLKRRLSVLLRRFGLLEEARQTLQQALALAPRDAHLNAVLGETLRDLGHPDKALQSLQTATHLDPEQASYWNALGLVLGGSQRMQEAQEAFERAFDLDPENSRYAFNLGLALLRQGNNARAREQMERALALDPDFAAARQELTALGSGRP